MAAVAIRTDIAPAELRRRAREEGDGRVAARLIGIANALEGMRRDEAARLTGMDRQTLRDWVLRYNEQGIEGLNNRTAPGRQSYLTEGQQAALKAIILAGPDPKRDQVRRWRMVDLIGLVEAKWGVRYSETGMLRLVWSLDLSHQQPRPEHPKADRRAQERFKNGGLAAELAAVAARHPGIDLELWFQDEARVGQKGRLGYVWWQRGERPTAPRDHRFQSAWIIGAVCPARDTGVALVMSRLNAAVMSRFLDQVSAAVTPGAHGVVVLDKAGWHIAHDLVVPSNLSLVFLPSYSPELNPIERLWLYLKENWLSARLFDHVNDIIDACCHAWNQLIAQAGQIRSLCSYPWLPQVSI